MRNINTLVGLSWEGAGVFGGGQWVCLDGHFFMDGYLDNVGVAVEF